MKSQYNNKFLRTNDDIFVQNTNNTQLSVDNDRQMTIMDYMDISHVDLGALGIDDIDKLDSFLHSLRTLARDVEDKKNDLEYEKAEKERREEEKRRKEAERQRLLEEERQRIEAERKHNEHVKNVTSMELSLDWNNVFNNSPLTEGVYAESIPDGYVKCLNNLGRVDIEYIASITGADYKTVIQALKGSIYQNPETWNECFYKGWEPADEYLSGNIRRKLEIADKANEEYLGYFEDNVTALSDLLPQKLSSKDIYVTLGSPWVPVDVIKEFCAYLSDTSEKNWTVIHDTLTASWDVKYKEPDRIDYVDFYNPIIQTLFRLESKYGSPSISALNIIRKTLNSKSLSVYHTFDGKKEFDKKDTLVAYEKQKLILDEFKKWIWQDKSRKKLLIDIYDDKYGSIRSRKFDGSFLEFPKMSKNVKLYKYQRDAVARIIFSPNTLLAHDVGAGKTYIMITAGMEMKRMGISDKNMYVVPNNILSQWKDTFYMLYPDADILCISSKDFIPTKREKVLERIKTESHDAVVIVYSCFSMIPISKECKKDLITSELNEMEEILNDYQKGHSQKTKRLTELYDRFCRLKDDVENDDKYSDSGISFDDLGITRLFVDEAHNFKNVPINTKISNVMGINSTGSSKCRDMMDKVRIVQNQNMGKGVVMATGTPITNSITDAYIMQKYLQYGQLKLLDLQNFDSWVANFAEPTTNFEIDVDTSSYRMATRFSEFHNVPELTNILANIADFHKMDNVEGIPEHEGYKDILVRKTKDFSEYLKEISERADNVRNGIVKRTKDNMLLITTDGRKAALDLRLVDLNYGFTVASKVFQCAEKVSDIYDRTQGDRSAQLVFCDTSTPKNGFNIYTELRSLLVKMGVDNSEIAFIHDAGSDSAKEKLFAKIRSGEIRVLIGSTFKLGLGVNVQDKLIALHHLDVPWRPADMVQREGRILRQGNENSKVEIYRYITEGSFDAYSWQLLETKQRFITEILSGTETERDGSDVDETVLNYAEVKALAVGNPLVKEKIEKTNELSKYLILQKEDVLHKQELKLELARLEKREQFLLNDMPLIQADVTRYDFNMIEHKDKERKKIREEIYKAINSEENSNGDRTLMKYQGFDLVIPRICSAYNPVVYLVGEKRYIVKLGDSAVGNLIKIDNRLNSLGTDYKKAEEEFVSIKSRRKTINTELSKENVYIEQIERCREELKEIDEKLGI